MQGTKVILGTYNTMPEGASSSLFELTYQSSWRPFLSSLYKFSNIRSVLYYSGTILQWIEANHPEFILLLEEMTARKQVELLGGGFFSPLMSALQPADKLGQVELLTTYLRKTFGKRPSGGWLYEYAWDENVPLLFSNAGLRYSFLPAKSLIAAGVLDADTLPVLITEDQRKLLYIFPVMDLEEEFEEPPPFESALEMLMSRYPAAELHTLMLNGQSIPWMWNVSALESPDVLFEKTFAWFQKNCLTIETVTAQEYAKTTEAAMPPVYLSACASQRLCRGCTLKNPAIVNDVNGGEYPTVPCQVNVRQMIAQNDSSRRLYDKMYYVDTLISLLRGDKARKKSAQEDLWRSQSGDAFWEGRLGGIRRPDVRVAAYQALIDAEKTTRVHGIFVPGLILDDIDCDGRKELLYQAPDFNSYVHERGASIFELDSFKMHHNFCSVYPQEGESGLLSSFMDKICPLGDFGNTIVDLASCAFVLDKVDKSIQKVTFSKEIPSIKLLVRKSYLFQKHCISVDYEIVNHGSTRAVFRFMTTLNLQLAEHIEDAKFTLARGHEALENTDECGHDCQAAADSVRIECQQTKNALELRSDSVFAFRMRHRFDSFSTADLERLMENPLPEVCVDDFHQLSTDKVDLNRSDVIASKAKADWNVDRFGGDGGGSEPFYQGTEMEFGWDLEMPPDATRTVSLSLHLSS